MKINDWNSQASQLKKYETTKTSVLLSNMIYDSCILKQICEIWMKIMNLFQNLI